jgi:two-component system NtrC family sensor kinase
MTDLAGRLLLVDDEPMNLDLLESLLVPEGYEVTRAGDGVEALERLSESSFDVVLLDVMMPRLDGLATCAQIRERHGALPVVLVTALADRRSRLAGIEAGADDLLSKPIDDVELLARMRNLVRLQRMHEAMRAGERSRARARVEAEQARHRQELFRLLPCGVTIHDREGRIIEANDAVAELLGVPRERLIGAWPHDLVKMTDAGGLDYVRERSATRQALETGARAERLSSFVRADGVRRWLEIVAAPIFDDAGTVERVVATQTDVTERRALDAQLRQADRLSSIGSLAAGIAHEISNPLTFVLANLDCVDDWLERGAAPGAVEEMRVVLAEARDGIGRASGLLRDFRMLARAESDAPDAVATPRPVDLRAALDAICGLASREIDRSARLVRRYGAVPLVLADATRLGQVFLNLLINASQAIASLADGRAHEIRLETRRAPDGAAVVEITDDGPGIAPAVRGRIFEPYFTTKAEGFGTGLGLSIARSIVTSLGGAIEVESELGRGTTFRVTLPAAA